MNILIIANCDPTITQGSGNVILNYTEGLKKLGHKIKFYSPKNFKSLRFLQKRAFIYRFAFISLYTILKELFLYRNQYDIIEFYGEENWLSIIFLYFFSKKKFIHHSNGPSTIVRIVQKESSLLSELGYLLKKKSITKARNIALVSSFCYQHVLNDLKVDKGKVIYINNGIDSFYIDKKIDYTKKENIILFVGNFISIKGKEIFIETINNTFLTNTDWNIKIIGNNNPNNIELFRNDIRNKIQFIPAIKEKELLSLEYKRAKILFMPSIIETFGLAYCEAMAHKCVVIANNVGFLLECKNDEVLKCSNNYIEILSQVINHKIELEVIADKGYQKVQNLKWPHSVKLYESHLKQIINATLP